MEALCGIDIIGNILRHFEEPLDVLRCSAVSHRWHSAYLLAQTSALCLSLRTFDGRQKGRISGLMHWIQARHAAGNFCQLKSLTAHFGHEEAEFGEGNQELSDMLWIFAGAVLMLAGTWPLQRAQLFGRFNLGIATELPPTSIQYLLLCIHPRAFPKLVNLDIFCKFEALKTLTIVPRGAIMYQLGNCFSLSTTLANLTSLTLSSWPLLIKDIRIVSRLLPSLLSASLHVYIGFVNAFTVYDQVKALHLVLMDESPAPPEGTANTIVVESSSQLRKLVLRGPVQTEIRLVVGKIGLQLDCESVNISSILLKSSNVECHEVDQHLWHFF